MQAADDRIKQQETTPFVTKSRGHFVRAALDLAKKPFDHIGGADRFPMLLGKRIEGQTGLQITLQARDRGRIDLLIFFE